MQCRTPTGQSIDIAPVLMAASPCRTTSPSKASRAQQRVSPARDNSLMSAVQEADVVKTRRMRNGFVPCSAIEIPSCEASSEIPESMSSVTSLRLMQSGIRMRALGSPASEHDDEEFRDSSESPIKLYRPRFSFPSDIEHLMSPANCMPSQGHTANRSQERPSSLLFAPLSLPPVQEVDILSARQLSIGSMGTPCYSCASQCGESLLQEEAKTADMEERLRKLRSQEQHLARETQELEAERQRFELEKNELDEDRRNFLLHRVHAADADVMRRENDLLAGHKDLESSNDDLEHRQWELENDRKILHESKRNLAHEQARLQQERIRFSKEVADGRAQLQVREKALAEQQTLLSAALDRAKQPWPPWETSERSSTWRFSRSCIGLLLVGFAVSAALQSSAVSKRHLTSILTDSGCDLGKWIHRFGDSANHMKAILTDNAQRLGMWVIGFARCRLRILYQYPIAGILLGPLQRSMINA